MNKANPWLVLGIILISIALRLTVYGDLRLSVANSDTASYVESSQANLFSWQAFTSYRPFTTNLVYQIFTPRDGYRYRALSDASTGTIKRKIDRGFRDIAAMQAIVSIVAWAGLAWTISSQLKNTIVKLTATSLILLFGFTPQLADWDSVMSAETLSISLFVLAFSILIWLVFTFYKDPTIKASNFFALLAACIALFFWMFTRDVNAYSLIILGLLILGTYLIPRFRDAKFLWIAGLVVLLFILGNVSASQRPLWKLALDHVWVSDILPYPARLEFFTGRGMPDYGTPEYSAWFDRHARGMYLQFLIAHPGFTIQKFFRDMNTAFSENMQAYFTAPESATRPSLIMAGNYIHSRSGTTFFIVILLLIILWIQAIIQNRSEAFPWVWVLTWAFLTATATMFFSIFGDTYGLVRHALSSTMTYRLLMWLLLLVILDFSMLRAERKPASFVPSDSSHQL